MNVGSTVGLEMSWCTNGCLLIIFCSRWQCCTITLYCFDLNSCIVLFFTTSGPKTKFLKAGKPKKMQMDGSFIPTYQESTNW
jgi:hypothetical protein